jgi:hypothetical protein
MVMGQDLESELAMLRDMVNGTIPFRVMDYASTLTPNHPDNPLIP